MNLSKELENAGPFSGDGDVKAARALWRAFRASEGFSSAADILTPPDGNKKLAKSKKATFGLTIAPANASGDNVCAFSTPSCRAACVLVTAGNARYPAVMRARIVRTKFLQAHPNAAITLISSEIRAAVAKHGEIVVRLNVASDLRWEFIAPKLFEINGASFYDYTKYPANLRAPGANYRLTYSVSERKGSNDEATLALSFGNGAAVVFDTPRGAPLPLVYLGAPVIDGDASDDRTIDPRGVIVGLRAKGAARGKVGTDTGFIRAAK